MKIKGTFLDEISHDIPAQNWGEVEWDADFAHMKAVGIESGQHVIVCANAVFDGTQSLF